MTYPHHRVPVPSPFQATPPDLHGIAENLPTLRDWHIDVPFDNLLLDALLGNNLHRVNRVSLAISAGAQHEPCFGPDRVGSRGLVYTFVDRPFTN